MWEPNIDQLPPALPLPRVKPETQACAFYWELIQQPPGAKVDTQPTEPYQSGIHLLFMLLKFSLSSLHILSPLFWSLYWIVCLPPFVSPFLAISSIVSFGISFLVLSFWLFPCVCFYVTSARLCRVAFCCGCPEGPSGATSPATWATGCSPHTHVSHVHPSVVVDPWLLLWHYLEGLTSRLMGYKNHPWL